MVGTGISKVCGDCRTGLFFLLFACCGCVNWTLVQSKTHRTMTARCAPPCTQCMIFNACVVKNMIAPCSTALRTLSFPKIVVIQKVRKSTKNVAKARPRNSTLDHNRFHKIVGEVHPQLTKIMSTTLVFERLMREGLYSLTQTAAEQKVEEHRKLLRQGQRQRRSERRRLAQSC